MWTTASGSATLLYLFWYHTTGIRVVLGFLTLCNRKQRAVPPSGLYSQGCSAHAASLKNINMIKSYFGSSFCTCKSNQSLVPVRFSWTLRTETRSPLRGTVAPRREWPFRMKVRVVLPSGQIPGIRKCPLWSVTVRSFPERRMAVPSATRPPAPRTEPSRVCSSHVQASHSAFTFPITQSR